MVYLHDEYIDIYCAGTYYDEKRKKKEEFSFSLID